jgi:lipopolysaccharide biosynthesis protein
MPRVSKRLFLFAGFDQSGVIDDALLYYVRNLALFGDVIICMDNISKKKEVQKLRKYVIAPLILRHCEYDFGSYKRCFQYAKMKDILKNYEFVYLVNDSVFGPTFSLKKLIHKMERIPLDAVGLIKSKHKTHEFMESWFIRLNKKVFMAPWFEEFLSGVQREEQKHIITIKYEHGLTNLIKQHKCSWDCIFECHGRFTYNKPKQLFKMGCPFVKKASFTRHNGAAGAQIKYVLDNADENATRAIMATANRLYGEKYMKLLLTHNPLKIAWRNIWYAIKKLRHKKI